MSKAQPGPSDSMAFLNDTLTAMMAGMENFTTERFMIDLLEKMLIEGYLELKPGCTKEATAAMFAGGLKNLKLKLPAGL
jgi:hypothetical protein